MERKLIKSAFILLCLSALSDMYGQDNSGFLEKVSDKFTNYCRSFPWEEIYVHTDRDEYIAGENLWMKIYLIDRQTNKLVDGVSLAYFEVLNSQNRPVVQKRIRLSGGSGPGEVILPDSLSSGIYIIRAYTSRMKNFLPENCFHKKIIIYNALNSRNLNVIFPDLRFAGSSGKDIKTETKQNIGLGLQVERSLSGDLTMVVRSNTGFRSANGNTLYLFVQTHGIINYTGSIDINGDSLRKTIPHNLLPPGINQIVIFNQNGDLLLERFCYTRKSLSDQLTVESDTAYNRRDKVSLIINMNDLTGAAGDSTEFSISVAELSDNLYGNIDDYMIFGSEFGYIPDSLIKKGLEQFPGEEIDSFVSKLKSRWIRWDQILSDKNPALKFGSETDFHFLSGRLVERNPTGNLAGRNVFLSVPGKKATFRYATTEKDGSFKFFLPVNEELKSLIIQPELIDANININIETPFSETYGKLEPGPEIIDPEFPGMISRQAANYQVDKIYGLGEKSGSDGSVVFSGVTGRFYGKPDIELLMDDYIKLPVMPEVFFELLPGVTLKGRKSSYQITIADPVDGKIYDRPPVLFVDGVVINDAAIIANLDPEVVEEIDAVKDRYLVGDYLFYGMVNVITRAGDFVSNVDIPQYAVRLPYRVVDHVKSFESPDYSAPVAKQSHLPDFRNTLYWNPDVKTGKDGVAPVEFWASDYATEYIVNIQSVTKDGRFISSKKKIRIE